MRVKIIRADSVRELEEKINLLLKNIDDAQIIDIKYQGVGCRPFDGTDCPSAMIILK